MTQTARMITETSVVVSVVRSLNKAHVLKTHTVFSFIVQQFLPSLGIYCSVEVLVPIISTFSFSRMESVQQLLDFPPDICVCVK